MLRDDEIVEEPAHTGVERGDLLPRPEVVDEDLPGRPARDVQPTVGDLHSDRGLAGGTGDELRYIRAADGAAVDRPVADGTDEERVAAASGDALRIPVRRGRQREHL